MAYSKHAIHVQECSQRFISTTICLKNWQLSLSSSWKRKGKNGETENSSFQFFRTSHVVSRKGKTSRLEFFYKFSNVEYFSSNTIGGGAMKIEMHPVYRWSLRQSVCISYYQTYINKKKSKHKPRIIYKYEYIAVECTDGNRGDTPHIDNPKFTAFLLSGKDGSHGNFAFEVSQELAAATAPYVTGMRRPGTASLPLPATERTWCRWKIISAF